MATKYFSIAGWIITAAIWSLRRRGVAFLFGQTTDARFWSDHRQNYDQSLRQRLRGTERLRGFLDRNLAIRKSRLEAQLARLRRNIESSGDMMNRTGTSEGGQS